MSIHIAANKGQIAPVVLMPGDPLRAKFIADKFLKGVTLVSQTRGMLFYTGTYKGKRVSVGASGMGPASMGIYSYELYAEYDVEAIIRIGTCGAYTTDLELFDILNVDTAYSESTYAKCAWGIEGDSIAHQGRAFGRVNDMATSLSVALKPANVHSSDIFYRKDSSTPSIAKKNDCLAVEMESFALFANAQHLGKSAATILTVSDILPTDQHISAEQRESALEVMINLALETAAVY